MPTTGERLVELSTLTTGTALEHFLNIDQSDPGDGDTEFVYIYLPADVAEGSVQNPEDGSLDDPIIQAGVAVTGVLSGAITSSDTLSGAVSDGDVVADVSSPTVQGSIDGCD